MNRLRVMMLSVFGAGCVESEALETSVVGQEATDQEGNCPSWM